MRAFDPMFRRRRRRMMMRRGSNGIGILGLAGIGYAVYRFLQTDQGRAVKNGIVDQMRNIGERMQTSRENMRSRSSNISAQTF
jgi:hypothetical protein